MRLPLTQPRAPYRCDRLRWVGIPIFEPNDHLQSCVSSPNQIKIVHEIHLYTRLHLVNHWVPIHIEGKNIYNYLNDMMCIDLKDIKHLTFMVYNFGFVVVLFPLGISKLLFCMTLLFAERAKRILSLIIAIHEFIGCLVFPNELRLLSPGSFGFVMVLLRSVLITKNYFNSLFEGFGILIVHYPVKV